MTTEYTEKTEGRAKRIGLIAFSFLLFFRVFRLFRGKKSFFLFFSFSVYSAVKSYLPFRKRIQWFSHISWLKCISPNGLLVVLISFFAATSPSVVFSQAGNGKAYPYEGLLRESDLRARQIKDLVLEKKPAPEQLRLLFAGYSGNYLEFYDLSGESVFLRYRDDRFDNDKNRLYAGLVKGNPYLLDAEFTGIRIGRKLHPFKNTGDFRDLVARPDSVLIYGIISYKNLRIGSIPF